MFISYAHESDERVERVRDLWIFLRRCGIDAKLDRVAAQRRQDWALWMGDQIREADHILVIASPAYRQRAEGSAEPDEGRGVQWEARLIRDAFYRERRALDRFVPVVLPGQSREGIPDFLGPATSTWYRVEDYTLDGAETLLRLLLDQPAEVEPGIGTVPVLGQRDHILSSSARPVVGLPGGRSMRHELDMRLDREGNGHVRTRVLVDSALLGEQVRALPAGIWAWHGELRSTRGAERLVMLGKALWEALLDEAPAGGW
ncbi:toll/interleukin-1 receptor domain-containing protein [Actinosynnema sp. NPDC002837]